MSTQTLSLLIHCNLLPQTCILQLSCLNRHLYSAYKRYFKAIPKPMIVASALLDIYQHGKILNYYKYRNLYKYLAAKDFVTFGLYIENVDDPYLLSEFIDLYVLHYDQLDHFLVDFPAKALLLNKNVLGYKYFSQTFFHRYPQLFKTSSAFSHEILDKNRIFFVLCDPEIEPKNLKSFLQCLYNDTYQICNSILDKLFVFYPGHNGAFLRAALRSNNYNLAVKLLPVGLPIKVPEREYHEYTFEIKSLISGLLVFGHRFPDITDKICVKIGYNSWPLYCSQTDKNIEKWFNETENFEIRRDILCSHLDRLDSHNFNSYCFQDPNLLPFIAHLDFFYFIKILDNSADSGRLTLSYLEIWNRVVPNTLNFTKTAYIECLTQCFDLFLWRVITLEDRLVLDRLLLLGAKLTRPSIETGFYTVAKFCSVYRLTALDYLLDKGLIFRYEDVCQLYRSLGEECVDYPKNFRRIIGRMKASYQHQQVFFSST